jgi:hypothetical protein
MKAAWRTTTRPGVAKVGAQPSAARSSTNRTVLASARPAVIP